MPRHWRCSNGHAWTGDLGALTYCPDCGSADVYEVRPEWPATEPPSPVPAAYRTFVQSPATPAGVGDPFVQPLASAAKPAAAGDTLIQAPALAADVGDTLSQPALAAD